MRSRVRKFAHVLERIGLAMAGAASGLFVAAHVGSSIAALTSQSFIVIMMMSGAIGFYLGIDTPPLTFHGPNDVPSRGNPGGQVDAAEFLSAVGTFLAALTAFVSVSVIVFRAEPHIVWTAMIMTGWVFGVVMQIVAGTIARIRS
jgi:FtsH-binding integral membrane protein